MNAQGYLQTGQITCHNTFGREIPCPGSRQDGEFKKGIPWPSPRFEQKGETVLDHLTGLTWTQNANLAEFPFTWQEALDYVFSMNREKAFGCSDWRLPNRRELRSLMSHQTGKPALPEGHPFTNVFLGWYWTSTTAAINTAYAWYIHLEGARTFYGGKEQFFLLWPCRGEGHKILPATGQIQCYDIMTQADLLSRASEQVRTGSSISDRSGLNRVSKSLMSSLLSLCRLKKADLTGRLVTWIEAFEAIATLNLNSKVKVLWRLPNINELESLVDCSMHSPALPAGHPFKNVQGGYWSSTTSMFEPDWAWALYLTKGAIGVGQKRGAHFSVWAVCDAYDIKAFT